ncbi:MAG: hypothetical protein PVF58_06965 [Candidatus Methanofastidiosia archaeon]|jgi:hypothetical protein
MVEIPPEVITVGTSIAVGVVSNFITGFLSGLGTTINGIKKHENILPPLYTYSYLKDFWNAYKNREIKKGDTIGIYGVFSDLALTIPASSPEKAVLDVKNILEELLNCFSGNSNTDLQKHILKFDNQIDRLRLYLGSCIKLPPINGFRYCNLFDEQDIIPVSGLPIFMRTNVNILSPPFYGKITGYIDVLPSFWKRILKIKSTEPVALIVDSEAGGKLEKQRDAINPLYLSYWNALRYPDKDKDNNECIIATRGDYTHKQNYETCRKFLKTAADVEINKLNAQLLFEYDQVNRITEYQQILDQEHIDEILNTNAEKT